MPGWLINASWLAPVISFLGILLVRYIQSIISVKVDELKCWIEENYTNNGILIYKIKESVYEFDKKEFDNRLDERIRLYFARTRGSLTGGKERPTDDNN